MFQSPKHSSNRMAAVVFCFIVAAAANLYADNFGAFAVHSREDVGIKEVLSDVGNVTIAKGSSLGLTANQSKKWNMSTRGVLGFPLSWDRFGEAMTSGDFNNDGYPDLAIGIAQKNYLEIPAAGAVTILYGTSPGLGTYRTQMWYQGQDGIQGTTEAYDNFGIALDSGDFNGDGFDDLAVGASYEDIGLIESAGAVNIIYGSSSGLVASDNQLFHQDIPGVPDASQANDKFGASLAAADFNNDGYTDLAIGVPGEKYGVENFAGAIQILYGSSSGLGTENNWFLFQGDSSLLGTPEMSDHFGSRLATGDFNNDHFADLVVGVPDEAVSALGSAGVVHIINGSASGLTSIGSQYWSQSDVTLTNGTEAGDEFGYALSVADFNGDQIADLAISAPNEGIGELLYVGVVHVVYGSTTGLLPAEAQQWRQGYNGIQGLVEEYDRVGDSLASGDVNNDGFADLAIGVPFEDVGTTLDSGAFHVIYGSASRLTSEGNQLWWQGKDGLVGGVGEGYNFGFSLAFIPAGYYFSWPIFLQVITSGP